MYDMYQYKGCEPIRRYAFNANSGCVEASCMQAVLVSQTAGCVCVANPILVRHVRLTAIWLQPSTVPTKHLGCHLQCASCQHVPLSRNRTDMRTGCRRGSVPRLVWFGFSTLMCCLLTPEMIFFDLLVFPLWSGSVSDFILILILMPGLKIH